MYDDNNGQFSWWWSRLNVSEDWNAMTPVSRRDLLLKLKQCCADLTSLSITEAELLPLVEATDILTVFDAVLSLYSLQGKETKKREELLAYLRKVVINSWKGQRKQNDTWHKEIRPKKRGKTVSLDTILKYDPYRKRTCISCGGKIIKSNVTNICADCQRKDGTNSERKHKGRRRLKDSSKT